MIAPINNHKILANLAAFAKGFTLVLCIGAAVLVPDFFPPIVLGLIVGNLLAMIAHRLLFPRRWTDL
jgi:H+/Cl- antiporter ClcA